MNRRKTILFGIIALGVCIAAGITVYFFVPKGRLDAKTLAIRQTLYQAVSDLKNGKRENIVSLLNAISSDNAYASEALLPDYISFLKDSDGQVQWLGAAGLYKVKNTKATKLLFGYLKEKDLRNLEEQVQKGKLEVMQYMGQIQASIMAIMAIGESGDKSAIPLLESLRGIKGLQMEHGPDPVEKALAQLGSVKSLSNIPPGTDSITVSRASSAIRSIRDPNKTAELIATAKDNNCAENIRSAAIGALGAMKDVNNLPFILSIVKDQNYPEMVRGTAAEEAAKTKKPDAEESLLNMAKSSNSDIRIDGLFQLAKLNNEKYMPNILKIVLDKTVPLEERTELSERIALRTEPKELTLHVEMLKSALKAAKDDNSPADEIRVYIWKAFNKATGEEPKLELNNDKPAYEWLSWDFRNKFQEENVHLSAEELRNKVNAKIKSIIIKWNPENIVQKQETSEN
jgi:HEAT repeat protein